MNLRSPKASERLRRDAPAPEPLARESARAAEAALGNIVPFARPPRAGVSRAPELGGERRPKAIRSRRAQIWFGGALCLSAAAHLAALLLFQTEPKPMSSLGEISISVELVLGTHNPAGLAQEKSENEAMQASAGKDADPEKQSDKEAERQVLNPENKPEERAAEREPIPNRIEAERQPQEVQSERLPEPKIAELTPEEQPQVRAPEPQVVEAPAQAVRRPVEETVRQQQAEQVEIADRKPDENVVEPELRAAEVVSKEKPVEAETPKQPVEEQPKDAVAERKPEPPKEPVKDAAKPVEKKPDPKVEKQKQQAAKQAAAKRADEARKRVDRGREQKKQAERGGAAPANAANGVGQGRSEANSNYRGLVAAHLARFKQYPAEARARGDQGSATVTFRLDGGGRVLSVSLARSSGSSSLDQEATAMVRRASPFPAPPDGRAQSFTAPVRFNVR